MRFTKKLWQQLERQLRHDLATVEPLIFLPLRSVKSKGERAHVRHQKGGPEIYVDGNARADELNEWRANAVSIGTSLLRDCQRQQWSPYFIFDWGAFYYSCGMALSYSTAWTEDEGKKNAGVAGGRAKRQPADEQKVWVAPEVARIMQKTGKPMNITRRDRKRKQRSAATVRHVRFVPNYRDPRSGRRHQLFFDKKADALARRDAIVADYQLGCSVARERSTLTVKEAVERWLKNREGDVRPRSLRGDREAAVYITGLVIRGTP